ncbi:MAG: RDD family protein [Smithellaceae bacterium]
MTTYQFAGFWRRLVAYLIDGIIIHLAILFLSVVAVAGFLDGALSAFDHGSFYGWLDFRHMPPMALAGLGVYAFIIIAYFTFFHGMNGRTPGKNLLCLQVVSAEGRPITFGTAFLRSVGYLVSSVFFTIPLGYLWVAFDKKKQGWHDKIAGTVVILRVPRVRNAGLSISDPQPPDFPVAPVESAVPIEAQKPESAAAKEAADADGQKIP